jgi:predicted peptidase
MEIRRIAFSILTVILMISCTGCTIGGDADTLTVWSGKSFTTKSGNKLWYNILDPIDIEEGKSYPLVIFLHGAGERGDDNKAQLVHIAPIFEKDSIRKKYPSYVLFPQCPKEGFWAALEQVDGQWLPTSKGSPEPSLHGVMKLVNNMTEQYPIDTTRIYISGLSMGGFGTFDYVAREPQRFAAAIAICGGGDTSYAHRYAHLPMKIFHGTKDNVVSAELSRASYAALLDAGATRVEYIEYPEGNHDIWNQAFNEKGILDWLYAQRKK